MRSLTVILAVLAMCDMAFGEVSITCVTDQNEVVVSYDVSNEPNLVRIFTLDVTVDNNAKIVKAPLESFSPNYSVYPGSIQVDPVTGAIIDDGSPVANKSQYAQGSQAYDGTLPGIDTGGMTVEMGSLYVDAQDAPQASGELFRFFVDKSCNVSIAANTVRKGVVLENIAQITTLNSPGCTVTMACATCMGDLNGDGWLSPGDVSSLVSLLLPYQSSYYWTPAPPGTCGDMTTDGWLSPGDISGLVSLLLPYDTAYYWRACP